MTVELGEQHLGDAEDAAVRHRVGETGVGHVAELLGRLAREHVVGEVGLAHRADHMAQEHRLELLGGGAQRFALRRRIRSLRGKRGRRALRGKRHGRLWRAQRGDHRITRSARSAPACFSASRIATRSDGAAPIAFTARTISASEAPGASSNIGERCSVTVILLCCSTTVSPRDNGAGWLVCWSSWTATVRRPWLTAAGLIRTAPLMTTVPVRALTITRAGASAGSTSIFSTRLINVVRISAPCAASIEIDTPSMARAIG